MPQILTDTAIRSAKPADKPRRLFDGGGLYLEVSPAGGKWRRLKYRHGAKKKRLSLGTYPDTGLADAIATARAERDPAADRRGALTPWKPVHFASITEPAKVGELLRAMDKLHAGLIVKSALRLAPLLFVRPGELR